MYKTIIDLDGFIIDYCVLVIDGDLINYELKENEKAVEYYTENYIKPRWTGREWIESATDEEVREWEDSQPKPITPPKTNEELEEENKLLKAQVQALNATTDFHEELIAEMATILYA